VSITIGAEQGATYTITSGSARCVIGGGNLGSLDADYVGALTDTPSGIVSADVRSSIEVRVGDRGVILHPFFYGQRSLQFQGIVEPDTPGIVNQRIDKLVAATALPDDCVVSWQPRQPDGTLAAALRVSCKLMQLDAKGQVPKTWTLQLVAADPIEAAAASTQTVTVTSATTAGGRGYPRSEPMGYTGASGAVVSVTNQLDGSAPAVITLTGPAVNPAAQLDGADEILFDNSLAAGEVLTIDTRAKTATSSSGLDWYQYVDPSSSWWSIGAGSHTVEFVSSGGLVAGSAISVSWRDTGR